MAACVIKQEVVEAAAGPAFSWSGKTRQVAARSAVLG